MVARGGRVVADPVDGRPPEIDGVRWGWRDTAETVCAEFRSLMRLDSFISVGTHMKTAIDIADPLFAEARRAAEREGATLKALVERGLRQVLAGPAVHDARIAAPCQQHGVPELWTADRDFGRFLGLKTVNPPVGR